MEEIAVESSRIVSRRELDREEMALLLEKYEKSLNNYVLTDVIRALFDEGLQVISDYALGEDGQIHDMTKLLENPHVDSWKPLLALGLEEAEEQISEANLCEECGRGAHTSATHLRAIREFLAFIRDRRLSVAPSLFRRALYDHWQRGSYLFFPRFVQTGLKFKFQKYPGSQEEYLFLVSRVNHRDFKREDYYEVDGSVVLESEDIPLFADELKVGRHRYAVVSVENELGLRSLPTDSIRVITRSQKPAYDLEPLAFAEDVRRIAERVRRKLEVVTIYLTSSTRYVEAIYSTGEDGNVFVYALGRGSELSVHAEVKSLIEYAPGGVELALMVESGRLSVLLGSQL